MSPDHNVPLFSKHNAVNLIITVQNMQGFDVNQSRDQCVGYRTFILWPAVAVTQCITDSMTGNTLAFNRRSFC